MVDHPDSLVTLFYRGRSSETALCFSRHNTSLFSEDLCITDPATFVCKWLGPFGDVIDSAVRPGNQYLQVAGTTSLLPGYHDVVRRLHDTAKLAASATRV